MVIAIWLADLKTTLGASYVEVPALRLELSWRTEASEPSQGYWVLKALPEAEHVIAKDDRLKRDLQNAIKAVRAQNANNPGEWNLKDLSDRGKRNFGRALSDEMTTYVDFELLAPPKTDRDGGVFDLLVAYRAKTTAQVRKPIEISVIVRGSKAIARQPVVTTIANLASHEVGGLAALTAEEGRTKVFVGASDDAPPDPATWGVSPDHEIALKAAAFAFQSAKANNLEANQPLGTESLQAGDLSDGAETVMSEIDAYVSKSFVLTSDWQAVPAEDAGLVRVHSLYGPAAPWKIRIALQAVEDVTFQIRGSRVDGNTETLEAHPTWAGDIAALESRVRERQRERFESLRGRLLTKDEFLALTKEVIPEVEDESKIVAVGVETALRSIVFTGYFQPRVTDLTAGIGYSTDKQFHGSLSLTTRNLLTDESLLKLSVIAGIEKQEGEFSYSLPYFTSRDGRSSAALEVNAGYAQDDDQKLGVPKSSGFDEERFSATIRNTFQFSTEHLNEGSRVAAAEAKEAPTGRRSSGNFALSAGFSDTRLGAPEQLRSEVESGQVLFLLLDLQQSWGWKLRLRRESGLGETRLLWNLKAKKGFNLGPGDFDFLAANTALTAMTYFGRKTSRDFLLRFTLGGALVSGNSPIFEEFRLGGDSIVRGLEEGERIARGAVFETAQLGVALERLWDGGSQALGFDLKNIYANLFVDHAFIARRGSRNPEGGGSRSLEAIGASLVMAIPGEAVRGSLEFGYAWSPDSTHDKGRVFTSVRLDF